LEPPPDFRRKVLVSWPQRFGLGAVLLIPLLSLFGVLGDRRLIANATSADLRVRVESPRCARYGNSVRLKIQVVLLGGNNPRRAVEIGLPQSYLDRFISIHVDPASARQNSRERVVLPALAPGQTDLDVVVDLTPERYGWARGIVRVGIASGETVEIGLKTFIFP